MSKKAHCQACHNLKYGIKTRRPVYHTCEKRHELKQFNKRK